MVVSKISALLLSGFLGLPTFAAGQNHEDLGTWTVSNFSRQCAADVNACNITFSLTTHEGTEAINCSFSITGLAGRPIENLEYRGARCEETWDYTISSGWNDSGFTVVVIDEEFLGMQSFFGFRDDELVNGKAAGPKTQRVQRSHPNSETGQPRQDNPEHGVDVEEKEEGLGYADGWKLSNIVRNAYVGEDSFPAVTTIFDIEHPEHEPEHCSSIAFGKVGDDPATLSFYDIACIGTEWTLSWGYDAEATEDVAVMTLMNPTKNRRAYFGFRHVNEGRDLGMNGPEPTYPYEG